MRLVFAGFRHGHIMALYDAARQHADVEVVGACEEDAATANSLNSSGQVKLTHRDLKQLIAQSKCDAVAVGDYFAKRGQVIVDALSAGKHVISDKPICTSLADLKRIRDL